MSDNDEKPKKLPPWDWINPYLELPAFGTGRLFYQPLHRREDDKPQMPEQFRGISHIEVRKYPWSDSKLLKDLESSPELQQLLRTAMERASQSMYAAIFQGENPAQSNHPAQPQQVDAEAMRNMLQDMKNGLYASDPLLKRGIGRDWLCIIHPRLERHLIELAGEMPWTIKHSNPSVRLDAIMRRQTHVIDGAPHDRIEYMTEEQAYKLYPAYFAKLAAHNLEQQRQVDADGLLAALDEDLDERTSDGL